MKSSYNIILAAGLLLAGVLPAGADGTSIEALRQLGIGEKTARQVVERWQARFPDRQAEPILSLIRRSAEAGAPADLVAEKAVEGLAKGVPEGRLMPALDRWGRRFADAARTTAELRRELQSEGIAEREAILRLSVMQRIGRDDALLARLRDEAKANKTDLRGFLAVGEAVNHLTINLGLADDDAEDLGMLMMRRRVRQEDIAKFVRAIEVSKDRSTVAEAAQSITEKILRGMSPDEVLRAARASDSRQPPSESAAVRSEDGGRGGNRQNNPGEGNGGSGN